MLENGHKAWQGMNVSKMKFRAVHASAILRILIQTIADGEDFAMGLVISGG